MTGQYPSEPGPTNEPRQEEDAGGSIRGEGMEEQQTRQFRHYSGTLSRQSVVFLSGTFFTALCGYLFKIYVGRHLGAEGLGLFALGMATVTAATAFAYLGLPQMLACFVAVHKATARDGRLRGLLQHTVKLLAISTGICAGLLVLSRHLLAGPIFGAPGLAEYLPLFALLLPVGGLNALVGQYLRGHQEVSRRTMVNHFVQFPVKIVLTVGLFTAGWGLAGYVLAEVGSNLVALLLLVIFAARFTPPSDGQKVTLESDERSYAGTMIGQSLLTFLNSRADIFVLGLLSSTDQVGIYSIAVATGAFVPTLLRSVNSVFGPMVSNLHARGELRLLERLFQTSTKWCLGLTWPLVVVLIFFSETLMGIFGDEFRVGGPALALLALGHLVNVGTGSVGSLLNMSGHQRFELHTGTATALLILALNLWWIPRWGLIGAAAAVACGLAISNLLRTFLVQRFLGLVPYSVRTLRLALPMITSGLATWWVWSWTTAGTQHREILGLGAAVLLSYSSFLAAAALTALDSDDRLILRAIGARLRRLFF